MAKKKSAAKKAPRITPRMRAGVEELQRRIDGGRAAREEALAAGFHGSRIFDPLGQMRDVIHAMARSKGWYAEALDPMDRQWFAAAVGNLHGEVSELWESFRNGTLREPCDKAKGMAALGLPALTCLEEELADIIIRALDDAAYLGVDIARAVTVKHAFNASRPHRHGGKRA
jgi:hypothetical protein